MRQLDRNYVNIDNYDVYKWQGMNVLATFYAAEFWRCMTWFFLFFCFFSVLLTSFFFKNQNTSPDPKQFIAIYMTCPSPIHLKCFSLLFYFMHCAFKMKILKGTLKN